MGNLLSYFFIAGAGAMLGSTQEFQWSSILASLLGMLGFVIIYDLGFDRYSWMRLPTASRTYNLYIGPVAATLTGRLWWLIKFQFVQRVSNGASFNSAILNLVHAFRRLGPLLGQNHRGLP